MAMVVPGQVQPHSSMVSSTQCMVTIMAMVSTQQCLVTHMVMVSTQV